jgi:hypothetical protein
MVDSGLWTEARSRAHRGYTKMKKGSQWSSLRSSEAEVMTEEVLTTGRNKQRW